MFGIISWPLPRAINGNQKAGVNEGAKIGILLIGLGDP